MNAPRKTLPILFAATLIGAATTSTPARAEDPKKDDITVVPLNTALIKISTADNKFAPSFTSPFFGPGLQASASASVPLDERTRTAPFLEDNRLTPGFRGTLAVTWNSVYAKLNHHPKFPAPKEQEEYCNRNKIRPCKSSELPKQVYEQATKNSTWDNGTPAFIVGAESTFAYDSIRAYSTDDVSSTPLSMKKRHIELGATIHIWHTWKLGTIAFSLRGGGQNANTVTTRDFRRCEDLPSSDPKITGQACEDATVLTKQTAPSWSSYARASLLYLGTTPVATSFLPGIEARINFEQLGTKSAYVNPRIVGFISPNFGSDRLRARVGVGLETRTPFGAISETEVIPLGLAGMSF